ncbi:MAG: FAD-dependent oxidoreductase [Anaerolineaceae bacterium]|nr:FAD-dependent oxidoreductase [Anaerolineaceae bacterium]MCB9098190.1 FAD-dependent oxidoreductase [Anaerolineales bacterium]
MFDTIVIGKGLIGSAATRYLSQHSPNVAVIGPDEPGDWTTHRGVFASHYDQGRITRILDEDPVWALLAKRSIEQYHYIEANSGISFHYPSGGLQAAADADYIDRLARVGQQFAADFQTYRGSAALAAACPQFALPEDAVGVLEGGGAGYINPRALAAAQLTIARQQGASIIRETVVSVETHQAGVIITTAEAHTYQAYRVVIAAGAYSNMLVEPPLALTLKPRTILLAELPPPAAARLAAMPTLIYDFRDNSAFDSIYMVPPLEYPDGKTYIKIGGDRLDVPVAHSFDALRAWFNSGGSRAEAEALKTVLLDLIPDLGATAFLHKPCVTTSTPHHHPFIDTLEDGRLFVAAGGCGMAAKSSNEIGRLAAVLARHNAWEDEAFAADDFKIRPF